MEKFWQEHSKFASLQEMMLDTNAEILCKEELPEVLSLLPSIEGKDVIELGAGIGRFTGPIAEKANRVVAVDFMKTFISKNREKNDHYGNIDFVCTDVLQLDLPQNSADLVFSNWLLMYLENSEIELLLKRILGWLKLGGHLFCRESCFHQSGNTKRIQNPTNYRDPAVYDAAFKMTTVDAGNNELHGLELVVSKSVRAYIKLKDNDKQVVWLLQKVKVDQQNFHGFRTIQEFLDSQQYSLKGILRYEKIFGRHFISTGGLATTKEFVSLLNLQKGQNVLDVGCGIGGSAFYMAQNFGVNVLGLDLSSNMIKIAVERVEELSIGELVQFEIADATKHTYQSDFYDVVYSRDTVLHISDKQSLFKRFFHWLKPGGKLLITDYCCSDGHHSEQFKSYIKQRGYSLFSVPHYGKMLKDAGFVNIQTEDRTNQFMEVLQKELERVISIEEEYIKEFSQEDYDYIIHVWEDKLKRCQQGDQKWGLFFAEKPLSTQ